MRKTYESLGSLLPKEVDMLQQLSTGERARWFSTIYGRYAARLARLEYEKILYWRSKNAGPCQ